MTNPKTGPLPFLAASPLWFTSSLQASLKLELQMRVRICVSYFFPSLIYFDSLFIFRYSKNVRHNGNGREGR